MEHAAAGLGNPAIGWESDCCMKKPNSIFPSSQTTPLGSKTQKQDGLPLDYLHILFWQYSEAADYHYQPPMRDLYIVPKKYQKEREKK